MMRLKMVVLRGSFMVRGISSDWSGIPGETGVMDFLRACCCIRVGSILYHVESLDSHCGLKSVHIGS